MAKSNPVQQRATTNAVRRWDLVGVSIQVGNRSPLPLANHSNQTLRPKRKGPGLDVASPVVAIPMGSDGNVEIGLVVGVVWLSLTQVPFDAGSTKHHTAIEQNKTLFKHLNVHCPCVWLLHELNDALSMLVITSFEEICIRFAVAQCSFSFLKMCGSEKNRLDLDVSKQYTLFVLRRDE